MALRRLPSMTQTDTDVKRRRTMRVFAFGISLTGLLLICLAFISLAIRYQANPVLWLVAVSIIFTLIWVIAWRDMQAQEQDRAVGGNTPQPMQQTWQALMQNPETEKSPLVMPTPVASSVALPLRLAAESEYYDGKSPTIETLLALPPFSQDQLFALDRPEAHERYFLLPKEGEPLLECQDGYAARTTPRRYAIADGVSGSFMAGPWARIIVQHFVDCPDDLREQQVFEQWLSRCSIAWHEWIQERWLPTVNRTRLHNGEAPRNWNTYIRQGAQTTLLGCIVSASQQQQIINADIFALGDSVMLHCRQTTHGAWTIATAFPLADPTLFNAYPHTLSTIVYPETLTHAWQQMQITRLAVQPGDQLLLVTDTLAKWLLTSPAERLMTLCSLATQDDFTRLMQYERHNGTLEDDDLTLLILPIT